MPGGDLQLNKLGAQDLYLYGNPQMTYFKSVYRRHTNFAMETIRFDFEGTRELANNVNTHFRCKIPRNGDLLNKLYFVINLPDIYSGYDNGINYDFQWIPNIGTQMIIRCSLLIGGVMISELYGQWIEIWHEMFLDTAGKNNFDEMVGNVPDVFIPANNGWNAGKYPTSTLQPELNVDPISTNWYTSKFKANPYLQPPSIEKRKLYVPLPFWFCTNPGLSLPLIALQYHDVHLEFEMRPIIQLYTIIETRSNIGSFRTVPLQSNTYHHIGNFITGIPDISFKNDQNLTDGSTNIQGWDMDSHILGNYIFLDEDERKQFASNSHEYLIEQVYRKEFTGVTGTQLLDLDFSHPVKYLVWFGQRDDISSLINAHNNYTNWLDENIPPQSDANLQIVGADTRDELYYSSDERVDVSEMEVIYENGSYVAKYANNELVPSNLYAIIDSSGTIEGTYEVPLDEDSLGNRALLPTKFNFRFYKQDILKSSRLLFDGNERYASRDSRFFKYVQSYQHNFKVDKPGIYFYSFSLDPTKYQPSGACNMSRISNIQMEIETQDIPVETPNSSTFQYNVYIYAVNYNILRIMSGMAGTAFSN